MKKLYLLSFLMFFPIAAICENVEFDGIVYNLNKETKEASVKTYVQKAGNNSGVVILPANEHK